jgi:phosphonopyruvate decarboxylase
LLPPELFLAQLIEREVEFYAGVPDSLLKEFLLLLCHKVETGKHYICANEGSAIALATGYHLGTGRIPLVYMQNSGLGNAVNPLFSLVHRRVYSVPVLLLIGWRGEPGVSDEPQHMAQGAKMLDLLTSLDIAHGELGPLDDDSSHILDLAIREMKESSRPFAIVCHKGTFVESKNKSKKAISSYDISRQDTLEELFRATSQHDVFVCTTGYTSREVYSLRQSDGKKIDSDFLNVGAMGHVSQIALGLALSQPNRRIICVDGDGSAIMHMGALAIVGQAKPRNLFHLVINNGVHDSVGSQPTAGFEIDLPLIAKACGYKQVERCDKRAELQRAMDTFLTAVGPAFLEVRSKPGTCENLVRPPHSFVERKQAFMDFLRLSAPQEV